MKTNQPSDKYISLVIRKATIDDGESITLVHIKGWQESFKGIIQQKTLDTLSYEKRFALRQSVLSDSSIACIVAEVDSHVVGFCDVGPARTEPDSDFKGEVYALYVLAAYQRMGIGLALWNQGVSYLHEHRLIPFMVWTLEKNQKARAFYEKQSGVVCGTKLVTIDHELYDEVQYCFVK